MLVSVVLSLPRDVLAIAPLRLMFGDMLRTAGVTDECVAEVQLALGEACANVVLHAQKSEEFEVSATFDDESCAVQVLDAGTGFTLSDVRTEEPPRPDAESGRGMLIMRAMMDKIAIDNRPRGGALVYMEKKLVWNPKAPLHFSACAAKREAEPTGARPARS